MRPSWSRRAGLPRVRRRFLGRWRPHSCPIAALELVLPSHVSAGALGSESWFRDTAFAYRDTESANQLGHYLDWAFPTGPETFEAELASLLANETTSLQFVRNIDTAYQTYLATLR